MKTKMNVVGSSSPLPYLAASAFLCVLFLLQLYAAETVSVFSFLFHSHLLTPYIFAGETVTCIIPFALWKSTKNVLDTSTGKVVSSTLIVLKRSITFSRIYSLELNESGLRHRIFHTCDVLFRDRYGRTLVIWSFMRTDDEFRRKIRRAALLISAEKSIAEGADYGIRPEIRQSISGDFRDRETAPFNRRRV